VIARPFRVLARHWWQIRRCVCDGLNPRLFIHRYCDDVRNGLPSLLLFIAERDILIDHQDRPHFALELRIASF
jgi:hypothetical protein